MCIMYVLAHRVEPPCRYLAHPGLLGLHVPSIFAYCMNTCRRATYTSHEVFGFLFSIRNKWKSFHFFKTSPLTHFQFTALDFIMWPLITVRDSAGNLCHDATKHGQKREYHDHHQLFQLCSLCSVASFVVFVSKKFKIQDQSRANYWLF